MINPVLRRMLLSPLSLLTRFSLSLASTSFSVAPPDSSYLLLAKLLTDLVFLWFVASMAGFFPSGVYYSYGSFSYSAFWCLVFRMMIWFLSFCAFSFSNCLFLATISNSLLPLSRLLILWSEGPSGDIVTKPVLVETRCFEAERSYERRLAAMNSPFP